MISMRWFLVTALLAHFLPSDLGVASAAAVKRKPPIVLTRELLNMCHGERAIFSKADQMRLRWLVAASGESSILLSSSPQHQAACWMLYTDPTARKRGSERMYLQRYALAVLHYASTKSNTTAWDWPMATDTTPDKAKRHGDWMAKAHECTWYGVVCNRRNKVITELQLGFMKLDGLVPRELSLLKGLKDLDLHANDFQGVVPHKIVDQLTNLEYLRLHMNGFFGMLHKEIVGMRKLKELYLFGNYFGGTIPIELAELKNLEVIDFYANQFEGRIPTELGKLKKLQSMDLHDNNLTGSVPREICNLKLKELVVDCLGPNPEVKCDCCTICCRGLPDFKCVDTKTGQEIQRQ